MATMLERAAQLENKRLEILRRSDELDKWRSLTNSVHGAFLLQSAQTRLDYIRGLYAAIDATNDKAKTQLAELQGMEREALRIVQQLSQIDFVQKTLDDEMKRVNSAVQKMTEMSETETSDGILSKSVPQKGDAK